MNRFRQSSVPRLGLGMRPSGNLRRAFYGLSHDGGDYSRQVVANTGTEFNVGTQDFSMSVWVKMGASSSLYGILSRSTGVGEDGGWFAAARYDGQNGALFRLMSNPSGSTIDVRPDTQQRAVIFDGGWHHLLWSLDRSGNGVIYLDGTAVGTVDISSFSAMDITSVQATHVSVGAFDHDGTFKFNGIITDIRWWIGTALTSVQAAAEYANRSPYDYPTVTPTWQGVIIDALGATQINPEIGTTVIPYEAGAAAPTPTAPTRTLPPNTF